MTKNKLKDPYREWLSVNLEKELGVIDSGILLQTAVHDRGWAPDKLLGPRDVVSVLQDAYSVMVSRMGDHKADQWLLEATQELNHMAQEIPAPVSISKQPKQPITMTSWGRRAHDLPLMLARVHGDIAVRSLEAIRTNPELAKLERAAEWDVQATKAEVRRWQAEDLLASLRAEHSRTEVADQVASAKAQAELLRLSVKEIEEAGSTDPSKLARLAHTKLMLSQTTSFLEAFSPLSSDTEADAPLTMLQMDLQNAQYSLGVPLHPNVLRARHGLNFALWQAGDKGEALPAVQAAKQALTQAEEEASKQLRTTIEAARNHQSNLIKLARHVEELETRALKLASLSSDPINLARVRLEWRQARAAARIQSNRMEEAVKLLEALVSDSGETDT